MIRFFIIVLSIGLVSTLPSCIYDYPYAQGNNPSAVETGIDLSFQLSWDNFNHHIDFSTRARNVKPHRFIFEASTNGEVVCRDEEWLTDEDFSKGSLRHRFSKPLSTKVYDIVVWYEGSMINGNEEAIIFNSENLSAVFVTSLTTHNSSEKRCGYANAHVDFSAHAGNLHASEIIEMELLHGGSRFELIASDIQEFISNQKDALLLGDSFCVQIVTYNNSLNLYSGKISFSDISVEYFGDLILPFYDFEELKIAEGFIFCSQEDTMSLSLNIYNSDKLVVARTPAFSFPVKRGYITKVRGDFLSFPIDGSLSVNQIWEGEIDIDA